MTTIQIMSDLHIDYNNDHVPDPLDFITPVSEILVLAGDIGSLYKYEQLNLFLKKLCEYFSLVLYVPGNHEFYMVQNIKPLHFNILKERLYNIGKNIKNLYILDNESVIIGNTCIIGCTLWSFPKIIIPKYLVRIYGFNTHIYKNKHFKDLKYIENMIKHCSKNNYKTVIVTHHSPSYQTLNNTNKKYISLYVNNLDYLLKKEKVDTWICGHIHKNFNFVTKNGTHLVGNQKGKPKDKINDFSKKFLLEI